MTEGTASVYGAPALPAEPPVTPINDGGRYIDKIRFASLL